MLATGIVQGPFWADGLSTSNHSPHWDESVVIFNALERDALRGQVREAKPFPNFCIDGFLEESFAEEVAASFPPFSQAEELGLKFATVNERNKLQITNSVNFPGPIVRFLSFLRSCL